MLTLPGSLRAAALPLAALALAACSTDLVFSAKTPSGGTELVRRPWRDCGGATMAKTRADCARAFELVQHGGHVTEALAVIDAALKSDHIGGADSIREMHWNRGLLFESIGQLDQALEELNQATVSGVSAASEEIDFVNHQRVITYVSGPNAADWDGSWPLQCNKSKPMQITITGMHAKIPALGIDVDDGCDLTLVNVALEATGDAPVIQVKGKARVTVTNSNLIGKKLAVGLAQRPGEAHVSFTGGAVMATGPGGKAIQLFNGATYSATGVKGLEDKTAP